MFTGIVEDIGTIREIRNQGAGRVLTIGTHLPLEEVKLGDSIAVNGACLTAESFVDGGFVAVAARETLSKTALASIRKGAKVHLERALRLGGRLDGHLMQGHVDGVGEVSSATQRRESLVLWIRCPGDLLRYVVPKGSIAIQGVSLTVNEVTQGSFRVNIVPHTVESTLFSELRSGAAVNLEVDVIAKYVERLLAGSGDASGYADLFGRK